MNQIQDTIPELDVESEVDSFIPMSNKEWASVNDTVHAFGEGITETNTNPDEYSDTDSDNDFDSEDELKDMAVLLKQATSLNKKLKHSVYKRSMVIELIKAAYLRDVVTMKHVMFNKLSTEQSDELIKEWKTSMPSVDLRKPLELHAPKSSHMIMKPCKKCGGVLDVEYHDSSKSERVERKLKKAHEVNEQLRLSVTKQQHESARDEILKDQVRHKYEEEVISVV